MGRRRWRMEMSEVVGAHRVALVWLVLQGRRASCRNLLKTEELESGKEEEEPKGPHRSLLTIFPRIISLQGFPAPWPRAQVSRFDSSLFDPSIGDPRLTST